MTRIFFSAGDTSGDQHAARLLTALQARRPGLTAEGLGGPCLQAAGCDIHEDLVNANVFGLADALRALPHYFGVLRRVAGLLDTHRPDAVVIVDYPGLNLFVARLAHRRGIPVTYFIAPQLWSWAPWRARRFARCVDEALVIFPFEVAFFERVGIRSTYIGHPVLDGLPGPGSNGDGCRDGSIADLPRPVALLPGSRPREVERHMPILLAAAREMLRRHPDASFHSAHVAPTQRERMDELARHAGIELVVHGDRVHAVMASCRCAAVSSGTATLETAMLGTPHVVLYQLSRFEQHVVDTVAMTPWAGQANLLAGRLVCPEVIQTDDSPDRLIAALDPLMTETEAARTMRADLADLRRRSGGAGAIERAAEHIAARLPG